jgi:iron complex outermembrane receptor protein
VPAARWAAAAVLVAAGAGHAASAAPFNVPPGSLGEVAASLGAQARITIAITDADLALHRSPGVKGDLPVRRALTRALRGTGADAIFYDEATVRIVKAHGPKPRTGQPPAPPHPAEATTGEPLDIVITASKQGLSRDVYPGSLKLIAFGAGWVASNAAGGTNAITRLLPTLGSTNLGPARNKLFIRGIADSSFNGPTQATVGQYLGDVRLNYNAPDPNLNLYDMKRVEILVGPQGTLYGASSLGGIIRLVPNEPDTHDTSATGSAGVSSTRHGGIGGDAAAMLNLPLIDGRVAVRLVGFGTREAGYIDDPSRGLKNINATKSYGQRVAFRIEDLWGFDIDLGGATHNTVTSDGQYTIRGDPALTRSSAIAQPFRNTYYLGYLTLRRMLGRVELTSTTSAVRHNLKTVFDATGYDGTNAPARFEEDNDITLVAHEIRASGGGAKTPWVAGLSGIYNVSALSRSLGPIAAPVRIAGVVNHQEEAAVFGQLSWPLFARISGTLGGRITFARSVGNLLENPTEKSKEPFRNALRFSPTIAIDWHPPGRFSAFFHFQQGYRAGGLAVAPSGSALESRKFATDDLSMSEFGIRLGNKEQNRLSVRAAIFFADWNNIQADLIDSTGLPYTTNIGSGRVFGLDGEVVWRPLPALTLTVSAFLNDSNLYAPAPDFAVTSKRTLPNIAHNGSRIAAAWHREIAPGVALSAEASVRFVGKSLLGAGPLLDIQQGGYGVADAGARIDFGKYAVSLDIANIGDARTNSFAFGNPFGLARRDQMTPLRPRTVRLGFAARF